MRDVRRGDSEGGFIEFSSYRWRDLQPALFGAHQLHNAQLFTLSALLPTPLQLSEAEIRAGLLAKWPGRYERRRYGKKPVVLDGAHNPEGVLALIGALDVDSKLPLPRTLIFGALAGRHRDEMLPPLAPHFIEVFLVAPNSPRAMPLAELHALWPLGKPMPSLAEALRSARGKGIVVAGSLYLVGEALALLDGTRRDDLTDYR